MGQEGRVVMEPGHLKELADTVVKIVDKYKDSPAAGLDILKSYFLGLGDGITQCTLDSQDTCTRCGKKAQEMGDRCPNGYNFGKDWNTRASCAYCPDYIYRKCEMKAEATESREELPEHREPAATGLKMYGKLAPKCSICCNEGELTSILTHNGSIFKLCDRCRKALDDPNVKEALHKG